MINEKTASDYTVYLTLLYDFASHFENYKYRKTRVGQELTHFYMQANDASIDPTTINENGAYINLTEHDDYITYSLRIARDLDSSETEWMTRKKRLLSTMEKGVFSCGLGLNRAKFSVFSRKSGIQAASQPFWRPILSFLRQKRRGTFGVSFLCKDVTKVFT